MQFHSEKEKVINSVFLKHVVWLQLLPIVTICGWEANIRLEKLLKQYSYIFLKRKNLVGNFWSVQRMTRLLSIRAIKVVERLGEMHLRRSTKQKDFFQS